MMHTADKISNVSIATPAEPIVTFDLLSKGDTVLVAYQRRTYVLTNRRHTRHFTVSDSLILSVYVFLCLCDGLVYLYKKLLSRQRISAIIIVERAGDRQQTARNCISRTSVEHLSRCACSWQPVDMSSELLYNNDDTARSGAV